MELLHQLVIIDDQKSDWYGYWGFVRKWDGKAYHVSGGSFPEGESYRFSGAQFKMPPADYEMYRKMGAKVTRFGREIID